MQCQNLIGTFNDMISWQLQMEADLLQAVSKSQRIRRSAPRWKALEKALVIAFAERRLLGRVVRRKWFERTAKRLHHELYPDSTVEFRFSQGWFQRFLIRNAITLRIITNKHKRLPRNALRSSSTSCASIGGTLS